MMVTRAVMMTMVTVAMMTIDDEKVKNTNKKHTWSRCHAFAVSIAPSR